MIKDINSKSYLVGMIVVISVLAYILIRYLAMPGISLLFTSESEVYGYTVRDIECSNYKRGYLEVAGADVGFDYNECQRIKLGDSGGELKLFIYNSNYIKRVSFLSLSNTVIVDREYSKSKNFIYTCLSFFWLVLGVFFLVFVVLYTSQLLRVIFFKSMCNKK